MGISRPLCSCCALIFGDLHCRHCLVLPARFHQRLRHYPHRNFRFPLALTLIRRGAPKLFECPPLAYSGRVDQELVQELQNRILVKTLGKGATGQKGTHLDFQL
jgi:hypothetical protein